MQIITGKIQKAQKVVVYGPEGVGKTTFAAKFPEALFIDTEGSTANIDVRRFPRPSSWTMLLAQIDHVKANRSLCKTLIIDTADWAEQLCRDHICSKAGVDGIEGFGYGKGYVYLEEEFGKLLNKLQDLVDIGINIVLTAHAEIKKIEQPEEIGGYDHWQMKLEKKTMPLVREWADLLLFANFKTIVVNIDNQGAVKGKNKAQGGQRVMFTTHTPWWDAKNRHELPDEMPFSFDKIAHIFAPVQVAPAVAPQVAPTAPSESKAPEPTTTLAKEPEPTPAVTTPQVDPDEGIPKALQDLMFPHQVTAEEIQKIVAKKGYYPADTPIKNYDPNFIAGVLVAAWPQVQQAILDNREFELPFDL